MRHNLANTKTENINSFAMNLASRAIVGLIICFSSYQLIKGAMTLGTLSAIVIYLEQLSGMQNSFAHLVQTISLGSISCERIDKVFGSRLGIEEIIHTKRVLFSEGRIGFKNVTFGYGPEKRILDKLNFSIPGTCHIGLVGKSGCGKTTIANLMLRLYLPQEGTISIDDCDIKFIKPNFLYGQIAIVTQEPFLWNDTIENNIKYGKKDGALKEVVDAARLACIDKFILGLPHRYNTVIGEAACKISEGQKQRIAIARAVIKKPKILILDEAMSSLDSETEDSIIGNIKAEFKNSTIVIVSHRASTIAKMDLVYFLENNSTITIDTHENLLEQNSRYMELFASQIEETQKMKSTLKIA